MKRLLFLFGAFILTFTVMSQNAEFELPEYDKVEGLKTDGVIQPFLDDFLKLCEQYNIDYHDKLFKLKEIVLVDTLQVSPNGGTLGMLVRGKNNDVEKIIFSWMTLLDKEILKVVAFHEFGHYFLEYKHICDDCNKIMAKVNSSYFDIAQDWDYHVKNLFINSPEYLKQQQKKK